jgi:hypothetical protein
MYDAHNVLEERGLIAPAKANDPLHVLWKLKGNTH